MLHINDLTYHIEGRKLFDDTSIAIAGGHKVGMVGRNGTGKSTLLRMISGEVIPDDGEITWPKSWRIGHVAQEAPSGEDKLIDIVLMADSERARLLEEAETATDPGRIADIQLRLSDIDAHSAPARAATILAGLGFDEEAQQRPAEVFSGGWRMRVALAASLFAAPDLLLLDEPSNYLDLEGTLWLENFLRNYPQSVLVVSHNRELLNNAVDHILHLNNKKLSLYSGNYDGFEAARREKQRLELKMKKKQDDARRHLQSFVDRFKAKATKARQAQSRIKVLEKMKPIAAELEDRVVPFYFPHPERKLGNPLIRLDDVSVGYDDKPVLRDLNLRIDFDDRIGLLGANGNGKSTLAKLLCGHLDPMSGYKKASKKLTIGYFHQHQMEDLNPLKSPYDYVADLLPEATEAQKRSKCAQLGFGPEKADTKAAQLSGGEKARLLFALASFHGPHLLILDEPTNHLDVDSCQALIQALNEYEGAIMVISHDRHLLEATVDRLWLTGKGTVTAYDGDMESYRQSLLVDKSGRNRQTKERQKETLSRQDQRRQAANLRAELAPMQKKIKRAEKMMEELQRKIDAIDIKLGDQTLYQSAGDEVQRLSEERGRLTQDLNSQEQVWLEASEAFETAKMMQQEQS